MLKKILIGLFGLIVLLLLAVAIGPRFVNWNSYKGRVAQEVRAVTGRDLAIDGDMSLSLLPSPALSVSGVRFANLPGGSAPDMARLKSLEVHVALVPLLSGKVQVTSVTLVEPVVLLERLPNGEANWQFTPPVSTPAAGSASPAANSATGSAAEISVDNFTIENGTVMYRAGDTEQKLEGLDATVVMRSLTGPFTATGQAKLVGLPAKFDLAIDSLAGSGPIALRGTLNVAGDAAVVGFDGSADQTAASVKGKINAKLSDPALVFKSAGFENLPTGLAQPFTLIGDLNASAADIALDNLALSLGDTNATGKIDLQPGSPVQGSIALAFSRLDLDKLMPANTAAPAGGTTAPASTSAAPGSGGFALPGQVVVNFDLSAEAVAWHQGVITRPHLAGRLSDGQLQIKQASALLPGGSDVSLAGTLASKDGKPQFVGAIQAKSDNLRDLANWLGAPLPNVSADRLRSLTLTSRVIAAPTQVELADLDIRLDASHIQGGVTVALPDGQARTKPAFGIGLTVDQLDADAYMPPKPAGNTSTSGASTPAAGKPASPLAGLSGLADLEANFDLRAGSLSYNGQTMRGLHLQGTLFGGKLTIAEASAKDIGGGQGSLAGSIINLAKDPRYDLKVNVAAPDAARVIQLAGLGRPAPGQYGALKLNGAVKGGADDVAYDISFSVTGPGVEGAANGTAQGLRGGVPRIDSSLSIAAKNAAAMFQALGISRPGMEKLGAIALTGKAASGKDSVDFDLALNLPGVGGKGTLKGKMTSLSSGTPQVATDLKLDAAQPAPLLALAGISGPAANKLGALGVAGHLEGGANAMKLALTVTALGGNAAINGNVAAAKAPVAFDVTISANHPDFGGLLAALGKPAPRNAGPLALSVHLAGDASKFAVKDLSLKAGDSDLSGNANVDMTAARAQFAATLASSNFNAAALSAGSSGGGSGTGGGGSSGQQAGGQQGGRWSRQPLDLSALDMADGSLDFKAGHLVLTGSRIDDLVAKLQFAGGTMTIQTLTGKIYGGTFAVSDAKVVGRGLPSFSGRLLAQNMEIAQLASTDTVKGPLSISAGLAASGASEAEMIGSLQGSGHHAGKIQILSKLTQTAGTALLGALGSQLKVLQGVTDRLGGVLQLFAGKVNDLAGDFSISHGVVTTENTTLTNPQARALAHGTANLPLWKMAMIVDVYRAPDLKTSIMTINLNGPLDKPNVNLTGPLFQPGANSNPLQQLIPGLQTQPPANNNPPQSNNGNPPQVQKVDPMQQLLNGLQKQPQQNNQPQNNQQQNNQPQNNQLAPILQNLLGQPGN